MLLVSLVLLLRGLGYPSSYWHFNSELTPGPGITLVNPTNAPIISAAGTLVMDESQQNFATVNPAMVFGGDSTWIMRFKTINTPKRWSRLIDFANGPGANNVFIAFDTNLGTGINFHVFDNQNYSWEFLCPTGLWNPNTWSTVIVTIGPGTATVYSNNQSCSWNDTSFPQGPIPSIPFMSRRFQYIGKSNYNGIGTPYIDPFWNGEVDFIWYLPRTVHLADAQLLQVDAEVIGNAWAFQSPEALDTRLSLINSPSLAGAVLNLDGNNSQAAIINSILSIFGPTSLAARVRLDSFRNWSRMVDFSNRVTNDAITISTSPGNGINWTIVRGTQQWSMSCANFWQLGQWMDVVLTVAGVNGTIYANGAQCGTSSQMSNPQVTADQSYIGKSRDASDAGWDGAFEYVMYWNRALSVAEAAYISAERNTLKPWIVTHFSSWDYPFSGTARLVNGKAMLAEGQYVQVDSTVVQLATPFTVSMYVQVNTSQPNGRLMDFSNGPTTDNVAIAVAGMSNNLQFVLGAQVVIQCNNFFTYKNWTQITLTHNGTTASVYRDGILMCSNYSTSPVIGKARSMQFLGKSTNSTANFAGNFSVNFDYFMIFNWSFSATEAAAMPNAWDRYLTTCAAFVSADPRVDTGTCGNFGRAGTTCNLVCKPPYTPVNPSQGTCDIISGAEHALWTGQSLQCISASDEVIGVIAANTTSCLVSEDSVYDCPTIGNVIIIIHAIYRSNAVFAGFISGLPCEFLPPLINVSNPSGISDYYFSCILPPGTGFNQSVVLTANGKYSQPRNLLSYAAPVITKISGCINTKPLAVEQCERGGSEQLTISGQNFGPDDASVSIGGVRCTSTVHDSTTPHNRVVCTTPPGYGAGIAVQLFQAAGPVSREVVTLDYTQCPSGNFQNGTQTACGICSPGHYSSAVGQFSCALCDPGRYAQNNTSHICLPCPAGSSQSSTGMSECYQCDPGFYTALESAVTCLACDPGTNATFYGSLQCSPCPPGSVSEKNGTIGPTSCTLCESGKFSGSSLQSLCQTCPMGKFSDEGSSSCTECDPGYYQNNQGQSKCLPCSPGSYSAVAGRSECVLCDSGTATNRTNATSCDVCEPGKVSKRNLGSTQGLTVCTDCDVGTFMPTTDQALCLGCSPGSYANKTGMTGCVLCDPGYYQSNGSAPECTPCSPGTFVNAGGQFACLQCPLGTFSTGSGAVECSPCPPGTSASLGGLTSCTACYPSSYSAVSGQSSCTPCPVGKFGPYSNASVCVDCFEGKFQSILWPNATDCTPCSPGTYVNTRGQVACLQCPIGTFSTDPGAIECSPCPPGRSASLGGSTSCTVCYPSSYSVSGQGSCAYCPAGKFGPYSNASACLDCFKGKFQSSSGPNSTDCTPCSPGTYVNAHGQVACLQCPVGTFSTESGAVECSPCLPGTSTSTGGLTACSVCAPGSFSAFSGQGSCTLCPVGTFGPYSNASACIDCFEGKFQSSSGLNSTNCPRCLPGTYVSARGQSACLQCAAGYFSAESGAVECSPCPSGTFQGNSQSSCELCKVGSANAATGQIQCQTCPSGMVSNQQGMSTCTPCQANSVTDIKQSRCKCSQGFYEVNATISSNITGTGINTSTATATATATGTCIPCPLGTVCSQSGLTSQNLPIQNGYYLTDTESLTYQKCLSPKNCVSGKCENNRMGLLCSRCQAGYSMSEWTKECTMCGTTNSSRAAMAFTIVGLLIAVLVLYGYIIVTALKSTAQLEAQQAEKKSAPNSLSSFFTTYRGREIDERQYNPTNSRGLSSSPSPDASAAAVSSLPTLVISPNLPKIDDSASAVMQQASEKNDRKQISDNTYVIKITVNFFQVASSLTSLPISGAVAFPTYYMQFLTFFKFLSIDLIPWQNVGCLFPSLHVYTKLVTLTLVPLLMIGLLAIVVAVTAHFDVRDLADSDQGRTRRKKIRLVFLRGVIFTMFMLYPIISSAVLSHFSCLTVGRQELLLADFSVVCYTQQWRNWTPFVAVMTIVYPIGIPVTFFVLLSWNKTNLDTPLATLGLGFLYESYSREVWWFEVLVMLQKLALTSLLQLFPLNMQLGAGIVVAAVFLITLVLVQPELRLRNWLLHMLANVEIVLLLLLWHFSYKENITSAPIEIDAAASALFILLTIILAALLFLDILRWLKGKVQFFLRHRNQMTAR